MIEKKIDWAEVERRKGLVPREVVKEILEETGARVVFLEPGEMCMVNGSYVSEMPYSTGLKISEQEAFDAALHELLEARGSRNVIAFRQAVVTKAIGIKYFTANILAAMYTEKKNDG